jgi:hypothetical protein
MGNQLRVNSEQFVTHEFAIADARTVRTEDGAMLRTQARFRDAEPAGRLANEDVPRLGGGIADRSARILHRMTCRRISLVRRAARIGRHLRERLERHFQFLSRDLKQRGLEALSEFSLAGQDCNRACGIYAYPGVYPRRVVEAARQAQLGRTAAFARLSLCADRRQTKCDDQSAAAGHDRAS